ncbi:MAG: transposase [Chloroflexota bacterium]|nr:transposase [Chloroflexota bacterium]
MILAADEASLYLQVTLMRVWRVVGQTPVIPCDPGRSLTHFYGALNLTSGQETVMRTQVMNAAVSALFLQKLLAAYPTQPILLLWDRAKWHQGPAVNELLAAHSRLEIFCLRVPFGRASPDLNPQEHVWKATREAVSHNHGHAKLETLAIQFENHLTNTIFPSSLLDQHGYHLLCAMFN